MTVHMITMLLVIMLEAVVSLTSAQTVNVSSTFTIAPIVIQGRDIGNCPSIQESEAARNSIANAVHSILTGTGSPVVECGEGYWIEIANLNMSDSSQQCPPEWREVSTPARSCGRQGDGSASCDSVFFSVLDAEYSKVCGQMIGHLLSSSDAFGFLHSPLQTIEEFYVDGISVTYGSPRNHIWTLAAGHGITNIASNQLRCPCDNSDRSFAPLPPSFVGDSYFCDSENNGALWDGQDCTTDCCTFNSPPWFSVQLPNSTSNDIEVRICADQGTNNEDSPIELLKIYIQ